MTHSFKVLSERETLEEAFQYSIARVGDGEFRLALGGQSASQGPNPMLAKEMVELLAGPTQSLVCLPNLKAVPPSPKMWFWKNYTKDKFKNLCRQPIYGSTWITRPDDAPWINDNEYFARVRELWAGKDVVLVVGDEKSLTPALLHDAASVRVVKGPRQHAYSQINRLEEEVGVPSGPVLLCMGATATVLAERLAKKGLHALDLGHLGMFIRRREKALLNADEVASPAYRALLQKRYEQPGWGASGKHQWKTVYDFALQLGATDALDYGCGRGTLRRALYDNVQAQGLKHIVMHEYDPGIVEKSAMPVPADLVVATDVLEHIEPDKLDKVLDHIKLLARKGIYLIIACGPAKEILPDGRNAHLIQQPPAWWIRKLKERSFNIVQTKVDKGVHVWIKHAA